jgi:hypothetical protein
MAAEVRMTGNLVDLCDLSQPLGQYDLCDQKRRAEFLEALVHQSAGGHIGAVFSKIFEDASEKFGRKRDDVAGIGHCQRQSRHSRARSARASGVVSS